VCRLISLAQLWSEASLPPDPLGGIRKTAVLRATTATIVGVIGGERWQRLEDQLLRGHEPTIAEMRDAVGDERYQRELALDLAHQGVRFEENDLERRASKLAFALAMHAGRAGVQSNESHFAEFLLRLATEPASLSSWPQPQLTEALQRALASPVLLRAARFVVLLVTLSLEEREDVLFAGWSWR
jgi:hypothetical protein